MTYPEKRPSEWLKTQQTPIPRWQEAATIGRAILVLIIGLCILIAGILAIDRLISRYPGPIAGVCVSVLAIWLITGSTGRRMHW